MMAHSYAHLFGFPVTGVRFFTVYGPWGRPDMALFAFTKAILGGRPIDVFNHGDMKRDFTYIDDTVEGIFRLLQVVPESIQKETDPAASAIAPYRLLNIGRSQPELLNRYIEVLEEKLGRKAKKNMLPMQPGDVPATWADTHDLEQLTGYKPATSIEEGVGRFVDWYLEYYNVKL
jgi:UDP-glucuronate 4-epimerase